MNREAEICRMLHDVFSNARKQLACHRVILRGSRARGNAKPRSDFDVGVIALPLKDFYYLDDKLEELPTLYRIDWIELARASEEMRQSALIDCEILFEP